jgi:Outer membrane protein beta-barrel domain
MRVCLVVLVLLAMVSPAAAQSTYAGGSLIGEFARFGGIDVDDDARMPSRVEPLSRSWETLGFDLRVGRALGEHWGVELSFARGGNHEQRQTNRLLSLLTTPSTGLDPTFPGFIRTLPTLPPFPIPDIEFELRSEQQHTTLDTVAWLRQEISDRVDLVFLGGVSFNRVELEQSIGISDNRFAFSLPAPSQIETDHYGVGPVVGAEAVIDLWNQAAVTTGVRLHGINTDGFGGWLIRPSVGLRWTF